ncbi:MAG: hypothetical protein ACRDHN_14545 [Thermomicrobiales bacterium]
MSIAGKGDPFAVRRIITPELRQGLLVLHVSGTSSRAEELIGLGLAFRRESRATPGIFVATEAEAERVSAHAHGVALLLASAVESHWTELEALYSSLRCSRSTTFDDAAFLFVGDFVLDNGLLDVLAVDGSLMPRAPMRSLADLKSDRYYLWLIEGPPRLLGQYGQRQIALWNSGWTVTTFGQYFIGSSPNQQRQSLIDRALEGDQGDPATLAGEMGIPTIDSDDQVAWESGIPKLLTELLEVFKQSELSIRDLHDDLVRGIDPERTFGEFFCWYDHLAYAHAIDLLASRELLTIPDSRFSAAIMQISDRASAFSS